MKWLFIVVCMVLLVTGALLFLQTKKTIVPTKDAAVKPTVVTPKQTVSYTASFLIFTNGTQRIFTDSRYHNLSIDVFLEAKNPHVVHIKKEGVTWDDFFKTLPMSLTKDCIVTGTQQIFCTNEKEILKFYINGKKEENILVKEIQPYDQLLVSFGSESEEEIKQQQKLVDSIKYNQ